MSSILGAIRDASIDELELKGFHWRIRRVSSADLARVGFAWLNMATPENGSNGAEVDVDLSAMLKRADQSKLVELAKLKDAIIAAGLVAIGHDDEWDECTVTLKQSEEDTDANVIWIGSLPADVDTELFTAIMELSTEGGKAGERLASFRGSRKRSNAGATGRSRKKVQRATP